MLLLLLLRSRCSRSLLLPIQRCCNDASTILPDAKRSTRHHHRRAHPATRRRTQHLLQRSRAVSSEQQRRGRRRRHRARGITTLSTIRIIGIGSKTSFRRRRNANDSAQRRGKGHVFVLFDPQIERKENLSLFFFLDLRRARALKSVCFNKVFLPLVLLFVFFKTLLVHITP